MLEQVLVAGFGGQGVLSTGQLLAYAGMHEGKHVSWIPSYGPEMRGGTANCGITVSDLEISSPMVSEPTALIVMNRPSLEKFEKDVVPGGLILVNSSLIDSKVEREDLRVLYIPANEMAEELGNGRVANNIILGALLGATGVVSADAVIASLKQVLPKHRHNLIGVNREALSEGMKLANGNGGA